VKVVHAEGRSFASRSDERFDVIQASLVDTFAASTSGAFSLTENGLYTVEAWSIFLDRLADDGILTMSRWFYYREPAFETMRLVVLARSALDRVGVTDHADKVIVVAGGLPNDFMGLRGTGTILVKKTAFSEAEVERLEAWAEPLSFRIAYAPGRLGLPGFRKLMTSDDLEATLAKLPVDIGAPTDDNPFFFLMSAQDERAQGFKSYALYRRARNTVGVVLRAALLLTGLVILVPMAIAERGGAARLRSHAAGALFFLGIGTAFMLIEIAQMQRLSVMLGHPIYSLTIVLSTLLVSSGLGSRWIGWRVQRSDDLQRLAPRVGALLLAATALVAWATVPAVNAFADAADWARFASAVVLLAPAGFLMGTMFPMGMHLARAAPGAPTAWFWALNGAASTLASILAVVISIDYGIRYSFAAGIAAYAVATLALVVYGRRISAGRFAP
jgi:hypothetical protein